MPPHVAAEAGPNKIHAPKAEAIKLVVNENNPIFLLAVRQLFRPLYFFELYKPKKTNIKFITISNVSDVD